MKTRIKIDNKISEIYSNIREKHIFFGDVWDNLLLNEVRSIQFQMCYALYNKNRLFIKKAKRKDKVPKKACSSSEVKKEDTLDNAKIRQLSESSRRMRVGIAIPSGACPIRPKNFKSFPHGEIDENDIGDWAERVYGLNDGKYSVDAVKYWARQFWDINSNEFPTVCGYIMSRLEPDLEGDS